MMPYIPASYWAMLEQQRIATEMVGVDPGQPQQLVVDVEVAASLTVPVGPKAISAPPVVSCPSTMFDSANTPSNPFAVPPHYL